MKNSKIHSAKDVRRLQNKWENIGEYFTLGADAGVFMLVVEVVTGGAAWVASGVTAEAQIAVPLIKDFLLATALVTPALFAGQEMANRRAEHFHRMANTLTARQSRSAHMHIDDIEDQMRQAVDRGSVMVRSILPTVDPS